MDGLLPIRHHRTKDFAKGGTRRAGETRGRSVAANAAGIEAAGGMVNQIDDRRRPGNCTIPHVCGYEAACVPLPDHTHTCVCPHDKSPPTHDFKCPVRLTVTAGPLRDQPAYPDPPRITDRDLRAVEDTKNPGNLANRAAGGGGGVSGLREMRRPGNCTIPNVCGHEAACIPHADDTHTCVCPHDKSPPTADLKCPNRLTVPITPHPIRDIIPPVPVSSHGSGTGSGSGSGSIQPNDSHALQTVGPISAPPLGISSSSSFPGHQQPSVPPAISGINDGPLMAGIAAGCILLLFVILATCCWKRKQIARCTGRHSKNKNTSSCTPSPLMLKKSILVADRYTLNPQYTACSTTAPTSTVPLLRSDSLRFLHEIGEGCFGKVFKGELRHRDDHTEIVAIKVLKESASREAEEDFMREVDIMSAFRHSNILSLVGVVPRESSLSPMMVFEYMPHGDLAEVLRANARWVARGRVGPISDVETSETQTPVLDGRSLLSVALQVAAGMRYLAAQRFVHRDLACRNCLVAKGPVVKIADFGMSRDVYTCDYYKIGGSRLLPVRWMSPESVMYGRFTLESDIWSYGVVLWEIYSFGKQPYYGHTNEEVVKLILQGIMLIPPEDCPGLIYDLMRSCWKTEPRDRIRFHDIFDKLQTAFSSISSENYQPLTSFTADALSKSQNFSGAAPPNFPNSFMSLPRTTNAPRSLSNLVRGNSSGGFPTLPQQLSGHPLTLQPPDQSTTPLETVGGSQTILQRLPEAGQTSPRTFDFQINTTDINGSGPSPEALLPPFDPANFPRHLSPSLSSVQNVESAVVAETSIPKPLTLPRPPPVAIGHLDGILDAEGYLMPQESTRVDYLETLPD